MCLGLRAFGSSVQLPAHKARNRPAHPTYGLYVYILNINTQSTQIIPRESFHINTLAPEPFLCRPRITCVFGPRITSFWPFSLRVWALLDGPCSCLLRPSSPLDPPPEVQVPLVYVSFGRFRLA